MKTMAFNEALREGLHEEMARDDSIFVLGEDVITHGGPYKVTDGIAERFPGRIFETPIAEAGIVGVGVGAALAGMRPVIELMYLDFVTCAMDEVVNQAAKMRYMSGGQGSVPMVIRLPCGVGRLLAAAFTNHGIVVYACARIAGSGAVYTGRCERLIQICHTFARSGAVFRIQTNLYQ